jgi:hypothetical protein
MNFFMSARIFFARPVSLLALAALLFGALTVASVQAAGPAGAAARADATIVGKVRVAGQPVAGVRVLPYLWDGAKKQWRKLPAAASTRVDGQYRITGLAAGRYHLLALPDSHAPYAPLWYGADVEWDHPAGLTYDPSKVPAAQIRGDEVRVTAGQLSKGHRFDLTPVGRAGAGSTSLDPLGTHPTIDVRYHPRNDANRTGDPITLTWVDPTNLRLPLLEPGVHTIQSRTSSQAGGTQEPWLDTVVDVTAADLALTLPAQAAIHGRTLLMDYTHKPGTPLVGTVAEATRAQYVRWTYPRGTVTTSMQWLRDGVPIPGATGDTYTITSADVGTVLAAEATGTRADYPTGVIRSAGQLVRATPRTDVRIQLNRSKVKFGQTDKVTVDVTVTLDDDEEPQGYGVYVHQGCSAENPSQDECFGWGQLAEQLSPTTYRLRLPARLPIQDRIYAEFLAKPHFQWRETSVPLDIRPQPSKVRLEPAKKTVQRAARAKVKVFVSAPHNQRTDIRGKVLVKAGSTTVGKTTLRPMGGKKGAKVAARKAVLRLDPVYRTGKVKLRAIFKPEKVKRTLPSNNAKVLRGDSGAKRGESKKVTLRVR